jgi:hypothetical protein
VWVSSLNDRVQLFSVDGKYLMGIGGSGDKPGQFARPHTHGLRQQRILLRRRCRQPAHSEIRAAGAMKPISTELLRHRQLA